jgi:hypothetical protein
MPREDLQCLASVRSGIRRIEVGANRNRVPVRIFDSQLWHTVIAVGYVEPALSPCLTQFGDQVRVRAERAALDAHVGAEPTEVLVELQVHSSRPQQNALSGN